MDKPWKRFEREVAKRLGGERVPITGRQRGDVADVITPRFAVECKHYKSPPAWLWSDYNGPEHVTLGITPAMCFSLRNGEIPTPIKTTYRKMARPGWIAEAIDQACAAARRHRRTPLVVISAGKGRRVADAMCFIIYESDTCIIQQTGESSHVRSDNAKPKKSKSQKTCRIRRVSCRTKVPARRAAARRLSRIPAG